MGYIQVDQVTHFFDVGPGPLLCTPHGHLREREFPVGPTGPRGCSAILIDATLKWPTLPTSLPKEGYMSHAKELWESLGLPS